MKKIKIIEHLKDILDECNNGIDIEQIKHNVYEIAEHLDINIEELQKYGE